MGVRTRTDREVAGLTVSEWAGDGPAVLALHGLGSTGYAWTALAEAAPELRIIAPHLRGRGGSYKVAGPAGLAPHAADMARICGELGLDHPIVVGHSMGAFLAPVVAQELGGGVRKVVLLDGGIPPALPFFMRPFLAKLVFSQSVKKLDKAWPDAAAFVAKNIGHTLDARPDLLPQVTEMLSDDLVGPPGAVRPRLDAAHIVADAVDCFFGSAVIAGRDALEAPTHLLAASMGKDDKAKPFLSDAVVKEWCDRMPNLSADRVTANHLTLLFAPDVAKAVAP